MKLSYFQWGSWIGARRSLQGVLALVTLGVVGCGTASSVCECSQGGCRESPTCGDDGEPQEPSCIADPASGRAENDCGVFVSSSLGDDASPGTRERPVRTLAQAIAMARSGRGRVYACGELFPEAVTVPSGVEVWGGLDCTRDWIYLGGNHRTVLAPAPSLIPLRVEKREGGGVSTLADLRLEAAEATVPGGSAIAMLVQTEAEVELRRSELIAGNGANGEPGVRQGEERAKAGTPGIPGVAACSADLVLGAPSVTTVCEITSIGGKGGDGRIMDGGNGTDGQPEPPPNPHKRGLGGAGQSDEFPCFPGRGGLVGPDGVHGLGGRGSGTLTFDGWKGERGGDGTHGGAAQGGGGGGGSRGGALYCGIAPDTPKGGASGGSGGGGGCGGKGATGGGFGGASIGLVTLSGQVRVYATSISTGDGGDGGAGGLAQFGGLGGIWGIGGASVGGSAFGCGGGLGGKGGNGGYGGGGLGGPSLGVAHVFGQPAALHETTVNLGNGGKGGPGGNQAVLDSGGEDGTRADTMGFPQ